MNNKHIKDLEEVFHSLKKFNIDKISCLFIANDLGKIGLYPGKTKKDLLDKIYSSLIKINNNLTIVVPTANLNLINSDKVFDLNDTPSFKMGAFSEYIRKIEGSKRSSHPFWSLTAKGPLAKKIVNKVSDHGYDENSAFGNLFKIKDSYFLAIGEHPRFMLSIIHHFENMFKVHYRFTKSFKVNYLKNGKIKTEFYKLDVLKDEYRDKKRAFNKKIFENFEKYNKLLECNLGKGKLYYFNLKDFYLTTQKLFEDDINCWWK